MLINKACQECKLTKKAIAYYEQQGFVHPQVSENGYRHFCEEDIAKLKEVAMLRKLGLSLLQIKSVLSSGDKVQALQEVKSEMKAALNQLSIGLDCLDFLIETDYNVEESAAFIECKFDETATIKEKLLQAFPDQYGTFVSIHFGKFLGGKVDSPQKKMAYQNILQFFDDMELLEFPKELEELLTDAFGGVKDSDLIKMDEAVSHSLNNVEDFIESHEDFLNDYLQYKQSEEFQSSSAYKMQQLLLEFQKTSGYHDVFLANLKILSQSYCDYISMLERANEKFLEKFPKAREVYTHD